MKIRFAVTRFFVYLVILSLTGAFLFNLLLNRMSSVMHQYFIARPTSYNAERAERLSSSIYQSFKKEVQVPSVENIKPFIEKYNDIPFLSVNFVYMDENGVMKSVIEDVKEIDILSAEYLYPIKYGNRDIGTLLIYDINKEYEIGLAKHKLILNATRAFFVGFLLLMFSIFIYQEYSAKIHHDKVIAEYKAVHDGLTGLFTHKYFKEFLDREVNRSQRYHRPISLIMCDIDYFKNFNDHYGHLAGDKVLKTVSQIISGNVRSSDIVARYGGEEFAILLMETTPEAAKNVATRLKSLTEKSIEIADRIRDSIEHTDIEVDGNVSVHVTISMGVSTYDGHEDYKSNYLISEADHALYESKNSGRNLITVFDPKTKQFKSFK